ncbi:unnamed protein product [Dicrocoelium dendriticum]|nr:unnamed protein product [Dicrocoelium dendriticum]
MAAISVIEMPADNFHLVSDFQVMPSFTDSHNLQLTWRWSSPALAQKLLYRAKILYYADGDSDISERTGISQPTHQSYVLRDLRPNTQYLVCLRVIRQRMRHLGGSYGAPGQPNDPDMQLETESIKNASLPKDMRLKEPYVAEMQCDLAFTRRTYFPALLSSLVGVILALVLTVLLFTALLRRRSSYAHNKTMRDRSHCVHGSTLASNEHPVSLPRSSEHMNSGGHKQRVDKRSANQSCVACVASSTAVKRQHQRLKGSGSDKVETVLPYGSFSVNNKPSSHSAPGVSREVVVKCIHQHPETNESKRSVESSNGCCPHDRRTGHSRREHKRTVSFLVSDGASDSLKASSKLQDKQMTTSDLNVPRELNIPQKSLDANSLSTAYVHQSAPVHTVAEVADLHDDPSKLSDLNPKHTQTQTCDAYLVGVGQACARDKPGSHRSTDRLDFDPSNTNKDTLPITVEEASMVSLHDLPSPKMNRIGAGPDEECTALDPVVPLEYGAITDMSIKSSISDNTEEATRNQTNDDVNRHFNNDITGPIFFAQLTETL